MEDYSVCAFYTDKPEAADLHKLLTNTFKSSIKISNEISIEPSISIHLSGRNTLEKVLEFIKNRGVTLGYVQQQGFGYVYVDPRLLFRWNSANRIKYDQCVEQMTEDVDNSSTMFTSKIHKYLRGDSGWWVCFGYSLLHPTELSVFVTPDPYSYMAKYGFYEIRSGSQSLCKTGGEIGMIFGLYQYSDFPSCRKVAVNRSAFSMELVNNEAYAKRNGFNFISIKTFTYNKGAGEEVTINEEPFEDHEPLFNSGFANFLDAGKSKVKKSSSAINLENHDGGTFSLKQINLSP